MHVGRRQFVSQESLVVLEMRGLIFNSVLTGSLAQAISAYPALHFGLYFSQFEWFNPTYLSDKAGGFKTQNYVAVSTVPFTLVFGPLFLPISVLTFIQTCCSIGGEYASDAPDSERVQTLCDMV